ncbi:glutamate 5-kinase [Bacteroidia bacterium]|nr:glutamate 5-kinase [Bacteroidia bacterium]
MPFRRITIKIGSNVLTAPQHGLDAARLSALVAQIAALYHQGIEIIVVSSGAVAAGRGEFAALRKQDAVQARQLYSAIGQAKLIQLYYELFQQHNIVCGQVLTTKENFRSRRHYLTMQGCVATMLANGAIPIVNENDTVSVSELMFTDNDELSGLMSEMMNADALVILSNVDGIYNGDPHNSQSKIIREVRSRADDFAQFITHNKSEFGRGGMLTKAEIASRTAAAGIEVFIANGKRNNILTDWAAHPNETLCTHFVAKKQKTSSIKKWIHHTQAFATSALVVNAGAVEALRKAAVSLLPIGVTRIVGTFEKGDVVKIMDEQDAIIGVGKVTCNSEKASQVIGKKGEKELVHYNYLFLQ